MASLARSVLRQVLCAVFGVAAGGCVSDWWPRDDSDDPALGACMSTRRAPAIPQSANPGERLVVDATDTDASLVDVEIDARGQDFVGAVRISHGVGTLELGCRTLPIAIYDTYMSSAGRLFRGLVVQTDRFYRIDVDCDAEQAIRVRYEGTDGTDLAAESATGSCREVLVRTSSRVTFPALDMGIPPLAEGYTIDGAGIALASDGRGTVTLGGRAYDVFAFNDFVCGNCTDADDWWGLSLAMWDAPARRLTYAVVYLEMPDRRVSLESPITLPRFTGDVAQQTFDAVFSAP